MGASNLRPNDTTWATCPTPQVAANEPAELVKLLVTLATTSGTAGLARDATVALGPATVPSRSPRRCSHWVAKPPFEADHPFDVAGGLWALEHEARYGRPRWWP